jgi:cysteine desulfurase family protein
MADPERAEQRTIYLDHGATSWPKPAAVIEAVTEALTRYGGNPGRGAYALALDTARMIVESRQACARFLGVRNARDLAFLSGCTEGMNLALKGLLRPGDRVVACSTEHNAVVRPLSWLASRGVEVTVVDADASGFVDPVAVEAAVAEAPTRAVVCQHASNVTGTIQPIGDVVDVAHDAGALAIVDGAQAVGHLPVDLAALGADAYAASGHKALLGPQGTGLLYLAPGVDAEELLQGGTGSGQSEQPTQPTGRPDRYEAGTPNTPGIAGLAAGVRVLEEHASAFREHDRRLTARLHEGLLAMGGFRVLGPEPGEPRVPLLAVTHERVDADQLAFLLDRRYGIAVRAGLHCAPWAHRTTGTLETGALRFGIGYGTTDDDISAALDALRELTA